MDFKFEEENDLLTKSTVTISVTARNGRKCITSVTGLAPDLDSKKILSYIKKTFNCNGSIVKDEDHGEVLTFSGDQKKNIFEFFVKEEIYKKDEIILKGI